MLFYSTVIAQLLSHTPIYPMNAVTG